jgi:hypothetical protein
MGGILFWSMPRLAICMGWSVALLLSVSYAHAEQLSASTRAQAASPPTSFYMAPIAADAGRVNADNEAND